MRRRTDIEHTAGLTESAIHAAMMSEGGVAAILGLFCEVNAGVLGASYAALGVHEATAIGDVAYAEGRREVSPTEQHVHGFLERVPLMATVLLTVLHWDQVMSMAGRGGRPDWRLRRKRRPLSARYRAGVLFAVPLLVALPYGEELVPVRTAPALNGLRPWLDGGWHLLRSFALEPVPRESPIDQAEPDACGARLEPAPPGGMAGDVHTST